LSDIKAIETRYKGYRFRSRLEARWAVFFDTLGIEWRYEVEGFDVNGRPYLPDFFLPALGIYVEVKANAQAAEPHTDLFSGFSETVAPLMVVVDLPFEKFGRLYSMDATCGSGGNADFDALLDVVDGAPVVLFVSEAHSDCRTLYSPSYEVITAKAFPCHKDMHPSRLWWRAREAAKSARFEYGEAA